MSFKIVSLQAFSFLMTKPNHGVFENGTSKSTKLLFTSENYNLHKTIYSLYSSNVGSGCSDSLDICENGEPDLVDGGEDSLLAMLSLCSVPLPATLLKQHNSIIQGKWETKHP